VGDTLTVPAFSFQLVGGGRYTTTTTCRWVGDNCYIFAEDTEWGVHVSQTGIDSLARAFDRATARDSQNGIFPVVTGLFGDPPNVDHDHRILIVVLDVLDSPATGTTYVGYFDTENQTPPTSREILYVDSSPLDIGSPLALATLAHEFQHMVHWASDPDEEKWIDEGCSEYAELACGYKDTTDAALWAYLQLNTYTSLTEWTDQAYDFDQAFLWIAYFAERYGDAALRTLVTSSANGIAGVNGTLRSISASESFEDLFAQWSAAVYLDGPGVLGYRQLDLHPVRRDTVAVPATGLTRQAPLWGTDYIDLSPTTGVSLSVQGGAATSLLVVLLTARDAEPWATSCAVTPGATTRLSAYGTWPRALGVSRTDGDVATYTLTLSVLEGTSAAASDFDLSGRVDFDDFLAFAGAYGRAPGQAGYDPSFDLDGDGSVGFTDFLTFVGNYGATP